MTAARNYDDWFRLLDGQQSALPANQIGLGFYARRERDGETWVGIAIYEHGGLRAKVGHSSPQDLSDAKAEEDFSWKVMRFARAVTEEAYRAWASNGVWPEGSLTEVRNGKARAVEAAPKLAVSVDSNAPPEVQIAESIKDLEKQAKDWLASIGGEVKTQEQADKAGNYADAFSELAKEAEEKRTTAKAPVLKQGKDIDALWNPVKAAGDKAKVWAKGLVAPFLKAEQARKLAEAAEAAAAGEVVRVADTRVKAGTRGRGVGLRKHKEPRFSDLKAAVAHYAGQERFFRHPTVLNIVGSFLRADAEAGVEVPGASMVDVETAA